MDSGTLSNFTGITQQFYGKSIHSVLKYLALDVRIKKGWERWVHQKTRKGDTALGNGNEKYFERKNLF
jgi:hypothetical protein